MASPSNGCFPRQFPPQLAGSIAVGLTLVTAAIDLMTPANYLLPILYGVPLVLAATTRSVRFLWVMTAAVIALNFLDYYVGQRATVAEDEPVALVNRGLLTLGVLLLTGLLYLQLNAEKILDDHRSSVEKKNAELAALNQEMEQREEEIVRQNEELQSQTEELERQSEELRIANEELANREKILGQLLELSHSLTTDLNRDETLRRICEALGLLINGEGNATAFLEKDGDRLRVICHHGFGPEGPVAETLPLANSFSSLILSMGQTGYLEDLKLRPELHVPEPRNGPAFRSVLAAPVRVHGRGVGTIELYSPKRQTWSEGQIALIESLAAQAAISLQNDELIETIRQERRRFEAAFYTVPFGLAVADDPEGRQVRLNPAAAVLLGVPVRENVSLQTATGARLRRLVTQNDQPVPAERLPLVRALHGEEISGEEYELLAPAGRRLTLLTSAAPILDRRGAIAGAVCAFADITVQKTLQRELDIRRREAEETSIRKTRFLAAVSHDIRTPANAINLMAEVIRRVAGNPQMAGQVPELAERLRANALSLVELVSDVLDIARYDSGKVELQETEFALADVINEEYRQLAPLAQDKGLELSVELPPQPIWLRTDRVKLGRCLGNLIGNAIKFTDAGRIHVRPSLAPDRRLHIRVSDTGIGIPAEHLERIFDEFAQVRNPARDVSKGTGLGLAICKRLVEVMGGTVGVESKPGEGSVFTITLPASCVLLRLDASYPPKAPAPEGEYAGRPALVGMRLLLVEDHAATREGTAHLLRDEAAVVLEAPDGRSALRVLQEEPVDVLLLDMMLPDIDGREVLKALQGKRPPGLRAILVMTGDLTNERLEEVQQLGADALIGKPIDVPKLIAALRTLRQGR
jgi:signal transduction histidine kinase